MEPDQQKQQRQDMSTTDEALTGQPARPAFFTVVLALIGALILGGLIIGNLGAPTNTPESTIQAEVNATAETTSEAEPTVPPEMPTQQEDSRQDTSEQNELRIAYSKQSICSDEMAGYLSA